jgi:hypothetical protein
MWPGLDVFTVSCVRDATQTAARIASRRLRIKPNPSPVTAPPLRFRSAASGHHGVVPAVRPSQGRRKGGGAWPGAGRGAPAGRGPARPAPRAARTCCEAAAGAFPPSRGSACSPPARSRVGVEKGRLRVRVRDGAVRSPGPGPPSQPEARPLDSGGSRSAAPSPRSDPGVPSATWISESVGVGSRAAGCSSGTPRARALNHTPRQLESHPAVE